jgi:hypothetical protein
VDLVSVKYGLEVSRHVQPESRRPSFLLCPVGAMGEIEMRNRDSEEWVHFRRHRRSELHLLFTSIVGEELLLVMLVSLHAGGRSRTLSLPLMHCQHVIPSIFF